MWDDLLNLVDPGNEIEDAYNAIKFSAVRERGLVYGQMPSMAHQVANAVNHIADLLQEETEVVFGGIMIALPPVRPSE